MEENFSSPSTTQVIRQILIKIQARKFQSLIVKISKTASNLNGIKRDEQQCDEMLTMMAHLETEKQRIN